MLETVDTEHRLINREVLGKGETISRQLIKEKIKTRYKDL